MKTAAPSRTRRAGLLGVTVAGALALSGCQLTSSTATTLRYNPSDGVLVDGETFEARNLLVVSHGEGAPGVLSGAVYNTGTEPLAVTVTVGGQEAGEVTVEPGAPLQLDGGQGGSGQRTVVPAVEPPAGANVEVRLQAGGETLAVAAPVLLPRGPYEGFADDAGGTVAPEPHDGGAATGDH